MLRLIMPVDSKPRASRISPTSAPALDPMQSPLPHSISTSRRSNATPTPQHLLPTISPHSRTHRSSVPMSKNSTSPLMMHYGLTQPDVVSANMSKSGSAIRPTGPPPSTGFLNRQPCALLESNFPPPSITH